MRRSVSVRQFRGGQQFTRESAAGTAVGTSALATNAGADASRKLKREEIMKSEKVLMQTKRGSILLVLATVAVALVSAIPANATFSGKNGRIVFAQGKPPDIYTMNPDGSDVKQLTFFGSNGGSAVWGNWSPDGSELVFSQQASTTAPGQLWIMNADGSNQHLLLNDPSYSEAVPSFSPDGSQIVFTRCETSGHFQCALYRVQADGTGLTAITHYNPNLDVIDWDPAYSPDGRTIAFESYFRTESGLLEAIYLMNADGSNIHSITPPRLGAEESNWSPDGTNILFSSNDPTCGGCWVLSSEIWLISADEGETTRLTFNNKQWHGLNTVPHDLAPSWSPQGDAIVFERDAPDFSSSAIYVMNRDGSNQKLILQVSTHRTVTLPMENRIAGPKLTMQHMLKLIEQGGTFPRWGAARGGVK
jgi:Tol biopolymer transport system component